MLISFESYDKRIEALEAAVRTSNIEKAQNYTEALKTASETILGDIQGKLGTLKGEVQETVSSLQGARKKKDSNDIKEMVFFLLVCLLSWWRRSMWRWCFMGGGMIYPKQLKP